LIKRREYLDEQIQKISNKQGLKLKNSLTSTISSTAKKRVIYIILTSSSVEKSEDDIEREARLVEQWVGLTEERHAVFVPAPGSGIPGAPANWYVHKKKNIAVVCFFCRNIANLQGKNLRMFYSFLHFPIPPQITQSWHEV